MSNGGRCPVADDTFAGLTTKDIAKNYITLPLAGLTVKDVARRFRISPDKVRGWISHGELRAINTAGVLCGRPRWIVTAEALAEFEQRRQGGPTSKPVKRRRVKRSDWVDYYPD